MTTSALLLSMTVALAAAAPPAQRISVDVDARDARGRVDSTLEQQLEGKLRGALEEHGVTVVDDTAESARLVVEVRKLDVIDYEVKTRIELEGVERSSGGLDFSCKSCRVVELYDRVLEQVPQVVEAVTVKADDPADAPAPSAELQPEEPQASTPEGVPHEPGEEAPRPRPLGAVGIGGIAVVAGALGVLVYGGVVLQKPDVATVDPADEEFRFVESHSRTGWVWFGVGLGAAALGASMLAVDLTVLRQRRERRVAIVPSLAPTFAGGAMKVRF